MCLLKVSELKNFSQGKKRGGETERERGERGEGEEENDGQGGSEFGHHSFSSHAKKFLKKVNLF